MKQTACQYSHGEPAGDFLYQHSPESCVLPTVQQLVRGAGGSHPDFVQKRRTL